jgi:PTH1 family peptidyl-tRNA hydrolase
MWLVVGLGNPGDEYAETRHNVGFMVVDALSAAVSIPVREKTAKSVSGRGFIDDQTVILMKPLTYMNRSGVAVRDVLWKYDEIDRVIVVHDDLDLDVGMIRIRIRGSSGGHRGIESIIEKIGTQDFIRIKVGIGRSERLSPETYVLRKFARSQRPVMAEVIIKAAEAIPVIMRSGVEAAQNELHRRNLA